jgi:DNA-binding response OmpR family regulator
VLLVEDDADLAGVVIEALEQDGHQATHVRGPAEACEMATTDKWDAFVVDAFGALEEPDADYKATLKHLASHGRVVVTTARAWGMHMEAGNIGADALLSKPYNLADLANALSSPRVAVTTSPAAQTRV